MTTVTKSATYILLSYVIIFAMMACSDEKSSTAKQETPATPIQVPATPPSDDPPPAVTTEQSNQDATPAMSAPETVTADAPKTAPSAAMSADNATAVGSDREQGLMLARKSGCLACHQIEKKVVGPAWNDVAARYAGNPKAKSRLVEKVSKGGRGNWTDVVGNMAMPPYSPRVSAADIDTLVDFILNLGAGST